MVFSDMRTRRRLLRGLAGLASLAGLPGCTRLLTRADDPDLGLPPNPRTDDLPDRQHAWNHTLSRDTDGNPQPPKYHAILLLDLARPPTVDHARTVERAMRELETAYDWGPDGLLHVLAWGTRYFERVGALDRAPIEHPQVISRTDEPQLQSFDAALVLKSDHEEHLLDAERAMFHEEPLGNGDREPDHRLGDVFDVVSRRTGFVGQGTPTAHTDADGIPDDAPLPDDAPMFMGFKSWFRGTQPTEDRVTIPDGEFAGGTTMHLSRLRTSLEPWFALSAEGRVARMFSPQFTPADVEGFETDVPFADAVPEHAQKYGVVGHQEKVARARRDGEPVILRRDFDTVDGGHTGVHFLSLQRSLTDFRDTRRAMNGWYLRDDHEDITDHENNGILDFLTVVARANFYVPPRENRAFPLLGG